MKRIWFFLAALSWLSLSAAALDVGDEAPSFANPDPRGNYYFSKNIFGDGWVLLDFFATWCEPCIEKLPKILEINREYTTKGLTTVLFAIDKEGPEIVAPYFRKNPADILVLIDRYQVTIHDKYGETSIPLYFLIDEEGVIRYKGNNVDEIHTLLEENLKS